MSPTIPPGRIEFDWEERHRIKLMSASSSAEIERLISRALKRLHPNHSSILQARLHLLGCLKTEKVQTSPFERAHAAERVLRVLRRVCLEEFDPQCGDLHFQIAMAYSEICHRQARHPRPHDDDTAEASRQSLERFVDAAGEGLRQLCFCYGPHHPGAEALRLLLARSGAKKGLQ